MTVLVHGLRDFAACVGAVDSRGHGLVSTASCTFVRRVYRGEDCAELVHERQDKMPAER